MDGPNHVNPNTSASTAALRRRKHDCHVHHPPSRPHKGTRPWPPPTSRPQSRSRPTSNAAGTTSGTSFATQVVRRRHVHGGDDSRSCPDPRFLAASSETTSARGRPRRLPKLRTPYRSLHTCSIRRGQYGVHNSRILTTPETTAQPSLPLHGEPACPPASSVERGRLPPRQF